MALTEIVGQRTSEGKHILTVPINSIVAIDELVDGLHPNDTGYHKIALAWIQAVNQAQDMGWFQEPQSEHGRYAPTGLV